CGPRGPTRFQVIRYSLVLHFVLSASMMRVFPSSFVTQALIVSVDVPAACAAVTPPTMTKAAPVATTIFAADLLRLENGLTACDMHPPFKRLGAPPWCSRLAPLNAQCPRCKECGNCAC